MKKKSTLEKLTPLVVGTCMLTLVASCGSDDDDSSSSSQQEEQQEGIFTGVLTPVNSQIIDSGTTGTTTGTTTGDTGTTGTTTGDTGTTGTTTGDTGTTTGTTTGDTGTTGGMSPFAAVGGTVSITKNADEFHAMVDATEATAAIHRQYIYSGSRCPTTADDTNGDGYVDIAESIAVTGPALVPLDSDLSTQTAGLVFPSGANYSYDESTSYAAMLADLQLPDANPSDLLGKLGVGEELNVGTRVVMVHGIPSSTTLPATVVGADSLSPQQTLPLACTVLTFSGSGSTTGTSTGTTTGDTGTSTGTTTGDTGTSTGTTTGDTGTSTGTTTGDTGTTTGTTGTTTGTTTGM